MSNENELVIKIDQTGADKTAQAIGKVTTATKENAKAVETQAKATKAASVDVGKFGSALGIAGNTVGQFNSTAGQMVSRVGAATGAIQSLTTMGLGPLGAALTAVNLAVTVGLPMIKEWGDGHTRAASAADRHAASLGEVIARMRQQREEAQLASRLRVGIGSAEEFEGTIAQLREQQSALIAGGNQRGADALNQTIRVNQEYARRAREREATERNDQAIREQMERDRADVARQIAAAEAGGLVSPARRGGGAARAAGDGGAFANASSAKAKAEQALAEERAFADAQAALEEEKTRRTIEAQKERDALAYEERMAAEEKVTRLLEEEEERRLRAAEEADRARVESYQTAARAIEAIGGTIAGVYDLVDSAGASADESAEARQKRELKRMAFMQAVEAVINAARSAAAFASQDYVGGAAFAAASGLNIAAAEKAGVDAGNVPRTSGASAGGGMSRDNASRGSGSQGAGTIVINMNGPVIAASDRAELGRQLGQIINEGAGRYGA